MGATPRRTSGAPRPAPSGSPGGSQGDLGAFCAEVASFRTRLVPVSRSIVAAGLILILAVFLGIAFLYSYRAQGPGSTVRAEVPGSTVIGDATPLIAVAPAAVLFAILPLAVLFLVVYAAVRLGVRHERKRGPS